MSRSALARWFVRFTPSPVAVRWQERLRSCIGALIGIAMTGIAMHFLLGPDTRIPFLVAPMGASAVLLFAVPASPLAQPWSIIGGNLVSATVGVACAGWLADPVSAAALAVALAICAMFALRCVHPPSGAVALTAVLRRHHVKALPVTDDTQHIVGIVTRTNLVEKRAFGLPSRPKLPLVRWFKRSTVPAPVVGELMTTAVCTVNVRTPISELIPIFANSGHHHIPVLDTHQRLVGMITQADLITGLYRQEQAKARRAA